MSVLTAPQPLPESPDDSALLTLLSRAIATQQPLVEKHVQRLRRNRPDATADELLATLGRRYRSGVAATGSAAGAAAAAPGVGTAASLVLSAGETLTFLEASALYVMAVAEVLGVPIEDYRHHRLIVMAALLGSKSEAVITQIAGRTGPHWGRMVTSSIPMSSIKKINAVLGHNFVTKYGTKQGIIVIGRAAPFGIGGAIGGAAGWATATGVIKATNRAFGPADPDSTWTMAA